MNQIVITGIDTEVGKTIVSAIVVEALKADYWKLIQAGELDNLDSGTVKSLISNHVSKFHKEQFLLSEPISPHAAANIDEISITIDNFKLPETTNNNLVIEGAGGLMVPINEKGDMIIDLIGKFADEVILVTKNYLGSINHTLMSIEILKQRHINLKGLIFNGISNPESVRIIEKLSGVKVLGRIPHATLLNKAFVKEQSLKLDI
jgi:dethiobiotin synthetase